MSVYRTLFVLILALLVGAMMIPSDRPSASDAPKRDAFLAHLSTDKPIYRAGEKVYLRAAILGANDRKPLPADAQHGANLQITGPKGDIVGSGYAQVQDSIAAFAWDVPDECAGGQYTATMSFPSDGFPAAKRDFEVRAYRAPRLKGEIVFIREGFGPGDSVKASLHVDRAEGGIPAGASVHASAIVDGADAFASDTKLDAAGNVSVEFKLPTQISRGDGTLSLAITDGGVVETISKTIPILVNSVDVEIYPEGGDLIAGLPCRVYVEARTPNQKPADITATLTDENGNADRTFQFSTEHEGRGTFSFTPVAGQKYALRIIKPAGIKKLYPLPKVKPHGVSMMSDQLTIGAGEKVKLSLASTSAGTYSISLSKHETEVSSAKVKMIAGKQNEIELTPPSWADGVLVATVKDAKGKPVAERLIFRTPSHSLHVTVVADRSSYVPAGSANITVTTTDDEGKPVSALVGITATDASILQMIEKRERAPHLPAMVLLEDDVKELADAEIYLNPEDPKAALATDLLLGTQGWRRFATVDPAKFIADYGDAAHRVLADLQPIVPASAGFGGGGGAVFDDAVDQMAVTAAPRGGLSEFSFARKRLMKKAENADKDMPMAAPAQKLKVRADAGLGRAEMAQQIAASMPPLPVVRVYAHDLAPDHHAGQRNDFTETVYWCAGVKTDERTGTAKVAFKLSDSVTSFEVSADAFDDRGAIGAGSATISSVQPFYIEPKIPLEVTCGDVIDLPIATVNGTDQALTSVNVSITGNDALKIGPIDSFSLPANGRDRRIAHITVGSTPTTLNLHIHASADDYADDVTRPLVIKPRGFPIEVAHGGTIDTNGSVSHTIDIPDSVVAGSVVTSIALYPTPLANMTEALKRLMQEPNGCFEQTSSTTYPLVMADQYFLTHSGVDPELIAKSNDLLGKGYDRLKGFECKNKGYEWFGEDPGHECLSAFGLLEFTDMSHVRPVDAAMLKNTRDWLLARRDGKGGYSHERRALHTWIADPGCANGYCTWALLECGQKNLDTEVKWLKERAATDDNSYVTALAANALYLASEKENARALMDRLAKLQDKDGHVLGAKTTVVGSGGESLQIETTSLAALAWLREPSFAGNVEKAIHYLADSCQAGRFGSTQSTVLALRAIVAYDQARAHPTASGTIQLLVDDKPAGDAIPFSADTHGAIALPDVSNQLSPGKHTLALKMSDGSALPYSVAISYNSLTPGSSDECKLRIETTLKDQKLVEGLPSEARVVVTNLTDEVLPTPIAIIGLPGGLEVRHDQLKELVKSDRIASYEVRGREVILYWRDIQPKAKVEIPLNVVAAVPGQYTAPASRTYLYYTDEFKQWTPGMNVQIDPK